MPLFNQNKLSQEDAQGLERVLVCVDRLLLQKKRWRAVAEDGEEVGIDFEKPVQHGDLIGIHAGKGYVIDQSKEAVITIHIPSDVEKAATLGWMIGNMHIPVQVVDGEIRLAAEKGSSMFLDRNHIHYHTKELRFLPTPHSHTHGHGHSHEHEHSHSH
jgi:urease accessory protein